MSEDFTKAAEPVEADDVLEYDNTPMKNFPKIEKAGMYGLTLHSIHIVEGKYGKQRRHGFAVEGFDPEKDGVLDYYTAASGRGDKNAELADALGFTIDGPSQVKKSDLLGKGCQGLITLKAGNGDRKFAKIEKLIAA